MIQDTFQSIVSACTTKIQQKLIAKLIRKFSCESTNDLDNCSELLTSLYLSGLHNEALHIVNALIENMHFTGNFDLWPDYDFALAYQIADEEDNSAIKQLVYNKLGEVETFTSPKTGERHNNYFSRILSKQRIAYLYKEIEKNKNENDTEMEQTNRAGVIFEAFLVKAVNNDKNSALKDEMNATISEQLDILKTEKFKKYI